MKQGLTLWLAAGLLLTGCSGLPVPREMGDMALLRTIGVDARGAELEVTASAGRVEGGQQGEGEPAVGLSARRESLTAACLAMQGMSSRHIFFGHVDQLLLGERLAERGVQPVLDCFAQDAELSLGTRLWLIRGAEAGAAVASGGEEGADVRLATLQADGKQGDAPRSRTVGEVYTDLLELGSAYVPALGLTREEPLTGQGYGVLTAGGLAGYLEGDEAQGLELLAGRLSRVAVGQTLGDNQVSVQLSGGRARSGFELQDGELAGLWVECRAEGRLKEFSAPLSREEQETLKIRLEAELRQSVEAALARLQEWRTDCTGLGVRAALLHPSQWRRVQAEWPQRFAGLPVRVEVQVTVER